MGRNTLYSAAIILTIINLAALGTWLYNRFNAGGHESLTELRNQQFEEMRSELALSNEEVKDIQAYRTQFLGQMDSLSALLAGERTEMANELWRTNPDTARLKSLLNRISQIQSAAQRRVIAHILDVKSVLDSQQQRQFYNIVLRRFARGSEHPMPNFQR